MIVSVTFKLTRSTQKYWQNSSKIKEHLTTTPNSKTHALINVLNYQSLDTRTNIVNSVNVSRELDLAVHKNLKQKRDKFSNYAQKLVLKLIVNQLTKKTCKVFWNKTLTSTQSVSVKDIIFHSKARQKHTTVDPILHKKVHDFYERDAISQVLPYKNLMEKVKLPNGTSQHVSIRVMEMALIEAYNEFIKEYPNVKVQRQAFEMKQPKNVRLMKDAKRLVYACKYYVNINHMRKSLNHLLLINDKPLIKDNADLVDRALCSSDKIACIAGIFNVVKNA